MPDPKVSKIFKQEYASTPLKQASLSIEDNCYRALSNTVHQGVALYLFVR